VERAEEGEGRVERGIGWRMYDVMDLCGAPS
jgi:hypothetical protein